MKKKVIIAVSVVVLLVAIIGISAFGGKKKKGIEVKTGKVTKGEIKSYLSTTGKVESKNKKEYYGTQLKVSSVKVKVGDTVKKGQELITFETPDLQTPKKQAQIQYDNAVLQKKELLASKSKIEDQISKLDSQISQLEKSKNPQDLAKLETLKQQRKSIQPISDEKITQANNSVNAANLSVELANEKINQTQSNIVSDIDGIVTELNASVGSMGATGASPLVVVQNISDLEIVVPLGKYDANKIKIGMTGTVKNEDYKYDGKVSFIAPAAKQAKTPTGGGNTTLDCKVDVLEKTPKGLKVGFDADIDILLGEAKNILKVPVESIKNDKTGKNLVYVLKDGKAEERQVELGIQSDMESEIKKGLKIGEKVILNPTASIKNGTLVKDKAGDK